MRLTFHIRGEPVPWARPRFVRRGKFIHGFTAPKVKNAQADLRVQIISQLPSGFIALKGPLKLEATFRRTRPKSARKSDIWPAQRPDLDNLLKNLMDAMDSIVFLDDSQFVSILAVKSYGEAGIDITIEGVNDG